MSNLLMTPQLSPSRPQVPPGPIPSLANLLNQFDNFPLGHSCTNSHLPSAQVSDLTADTPITPLRTLAVRQQFAFSNETSPARPISPHVPRNKLNPTSPFNRRFAICLIITPLRVCSGPCLFPFLYGNLYGDWTDSRFYSCFAGNFQAPGAQDGSMGHE